jgi:hypothetical protein
VARPAGIQEENVWGHLTQRDTIVYYDNDFEIFLDPTANVVDYFEFEVTCLNTLFDMFHPCEGWVWNPVRSGSIHVPEMWGKAVFSDLPAGSARDRELERGLRLLDAPAPPATRA